MKNLYTLFFFLLVTTVFSQQVSLPDANFKAALLSADNESYVATDNNGNQISIDTNNNGEIEVSEALTVYELRVINSGIANLTGIQAFTNLTTLACSSNQLVTLDVSALVNLRELYCESNLITSLNVTSLPNLENLFCGHNKLTSLNAQSLVNLKQLFCEYNLLTSLTVSGMGNLEVLYASWNVSLGSLNLSGLSNLKSLSVNSNGLTSLNLTGLANLNYLTFSGNLISSMEYSQVPNLIELECDFNNFTSFNFTGLTNLKRLKCSGNQLTAGLNLEPLPNLEALTCLSNNLYSINLAPVPKLYYLDCNSNHLSVLNVSVTPNLRSLICFSNQLTTLDVTAHHDLDTLNCSGNSLTTLYMKNGSDESTLNFNYNPGLQKICIDPGQYAKVQQLINQYGYTNCNWYIDCSFASGNATSIVEIPDPNFKARLLAASDQNTIALGNFNNPMKVDANNDGQFQLQEVLAVGALNIQNSAIADLTGIGYFKNISKIYCGQNSFTSCDFSGLYKLTTFDLEGSPQLLNLNLAGCTSLVSYSTGFPLVLENLTTLNLSGCTALKNFSSFEGNITTLNVAGCSNLEELYCRNNKLTGIDLTSVPKLKNLVINGNLLTSLDLSMCSSLESAIVPENNLTSIQLPLQSSLKDLEIWDNQLSTIDLSTSSVLKSLRCDGNNISGLDLSPVPGLLALGCDSNPITVLDLDPVPGLQSLSCENASLASLDLTPLQQIQNLNVSGNPLPDNYDFSGLTTLISLRCSNIGLTSLNLTSLINLQDLAASGNNLTSLDISSNNLFGLDISSNPLTQITGLDGDTLYYLVAQSTLMGNLDISGCGGLGEISVDNSPNLVSINMKNGTFNHTTSFSQCPLLKYICVDENEIDIIQEFLDVFNYTDCHINSYCSFSPGGDFYTVQGSEKIDAGNNGCDASDSVYTNLKLSINDGFSTGTIIADESGNYSIPLQMGNYTITPVLENPLYFSVSPENVTLAVEGDNSTPIIQDFCLTPLGNHSDLEVTLLPTNVARPGFDSMYTITYKNKGTSVQSGNIMLAFDDATLDLISANPVATNQATNQVHWAFTNLMPLQSKNIDIVLNLNSPVENPPLNLDDVLAYTVSITGNATDETPDDNAFTLNQTVVNSLDPNDKTCLEGDSIAPERIGDYVNYIIRFENSGTYPAENIVVKDVIDTSKFDISTLMPLHSSHAFTTRITNGNRVEFIFQGIGLPFEDAVNDGYIAFKIKTWPTLSVGDTVENTADIYFDYNAPIVTNTASATYEVLGVDDFDFSDYFAVYPNPSSGILNVGLKQQLQVQDMKIFNTLGQQLMQIPNASAVSQIDVSRLQAGTYFIKITTAIGTANLKFIRQ